MSYVTANLQGGLGNQMFQIAAAEALALKFNSVAKFRLEAYTPMQASSPIYYAGNIFSNINFRRPTLEEEGYLPTVAEDELKIMQYFPVNFGSNPIVLQGYFQSEIFFENAKDYIRNLFSPTIPLKFTNWFKGVDRNSISIHIRRGDYMGIQNILPIVSKSYVDKALALHGPYSNIFIFSDDKEWAQETLKYARSEVVRGLSDYEEMWLMSKCSHNIISNSSFSWWASYLNNNPDKKVYVPSIWFGPDAPKQESSIYSDWMTVVPVYNDNGFLI